MYRNFYMFYFCLIWRRYERRIGRGKKEKVGQLISQTGKKLGKQNFRCLNIDRLWSFIHKCIIFVLVCRLFEYTQTCLTNNCYGLTFHVVLWLVPSVIVSEMLLLEEFVPCLSFFSWVLLSEWFVSVSVSYLSMFLETLSSREVGS